MLSVCRRCSLARSADLLAEDARLLEEATEDRLRALGGGVDWLPVPELCSLDAAWRQKAEFISSYVPKGRLVAVEGSIETSESTGEYIDDATTTTKVKAAFVKDPVVSAMAARPGRS